MDKVLNPYQPGAGRRPPELAGRDEILEDFDVLIERYERGAGERGRVLHGLRGVGKTVLLDELHQRASSRSWLVAKAEGSPDKPVLPQITRSLHRALQDTKIIDLSKLKPLLSLFKSFSMKFDPGGNYSFGFDLQQSDTIGKGTSLEQDLVELFQTFGTHAQELGIGVVVLIDEMQDVTLGELGPLNQALHLIGQGQDPLPVTMVGAGLPSLPSLLSRATTYAERLFEYHSVGSLDDTEATRALVRPAERLGARWGKDSVALALDATRGYPFFLQTCGKFVWNEAERSPFDKFAASRGLLRAQRELDAGLYQARWGRATKQERQILRLIAERGEGQTVNVADVAAQMGKRRKDLSVQRDALLKKGLLYSPDRGLAAFTVPGMADFVLRQPETD